MAALWTSLLNAIWIFFIASEGKGIFSVCEDWIFLPADNRKAAESLLVAHRA